MLTPEHNNMGDHAIAYTEIKLLSQFYEVVELTEWQLNRLTDFPFLFKLLVGRSKIYINGGGFLGTIWYPAELIFRKVLTYFKDNIICVFPQTIYYESSLFGKEEFDKSKQIYNACEHLILTAREKYSYDIMLKAYKNVYFIPDIVLFSDITISSQGRHGVQITFRNDIEKTLDEAIIKSVIDRVSLMYDKISYLDMCIDQNVKSAERENALFSHFEKFSQSELVVTDRLHGMIFSAITGTPCAVFNSMSPKVKGVYELAFSDCEYIKMINSVEELDDFIQRVKGKSYVYDKSYLAPYYKKLLELFVED